MRDCTIGGKRPRIGILGIGYLCGTDALCRSHMLYQYHERYEIRAYIIVCEPCMWNDWWYTPQVTPKTRGSEEGGQCSSAAMRSLTCTNILRHLALLTDDILMAIIDIPH